MGNVYQASLGQNPARQAALFAGRVLFTTSLLLAFNHVHPLLDNPLNFKTLLRLTSFNIADNLS